MPRGGKREGSGAKRKPDSKNVTIAFRVRERNKEKIKQAVLELAKKMDV